MPYGKAATCVGERARVFIKCVAVSVVCKLCEGVSRADGRAMETSQLDGGLSFFLRKVPRWC